MITIRELTPGDIPALRELAIRIYRDTFSHQNSEENMEAFLQKDYSEQSFQREFAEEGSQYFFASDNGIPVAYLRLRHSNEAEQHLGPNTIELHRLYVDINYQGRKIGDLLMDFALQQAALQKVDWIWLGVWEHNLRAQRFYDRWGFTRFGEHIFQMGEDAQTDWLLKRRVQY
jgi:ribosomal protein S18 acetylase RimI-like enzyme